MSVKKLDTTISYNDSYNFNDGDGSDHYSEIDDSSYCEEESDTKIKQQTKKRRRTTWKQQDEEKLLNLYYQIREDPQYTSVSSSCKKINDDQHFPKHGLSSIVTKLSRMLKDSQKTTPTKKKRSSTTSITTTTTNSSPKTTPSKPNYTSDSGINYKKKQIHIKPTIWSNEIALSLWDTYKDLRDTELYANDSAIVGKIVEEQKFKSFTHSQIYNKVTTLKRRIKEEEASYDSDEEILANEAPVVKTEENKNGSNTTTTNNSNNNNNNGDDSDDEDDEDNEDLQKELKEYKETIATQANKINELELKNQQLLIQQKQKIKLEHQQTQQQQTQQTQQSQQTMSSLGAHFNDNTMVLSSNTAIIIKTNSSNQDIYILFPTFAGDSEIKFAEPLNGRYHIEITSKTNSLSNISHYYIKQFDKNVYNDHPVVCKVKYNQSMCNGILFKKKVIPIFTIDDCNDINVLSTTN